MTYPWRPTLPRIHKPGDPPPVGYQDWQDWAHVQTKAGLKQRQCVRCKLWNFPQELASTEPVVCRDCNATQPHAG
jgi:hypothetical protein